MDFARYSTFLSYPEELHPDLPQKLQAFSLLELQQHYVATFDQKASCSLYLFEHVQGESRERGQAMVDLLSIYEQEGLFIASTELPDYLPLFLEFLSLITPEEARSFLAEIIHILGNLEKNLLESGSPYAELIGTLIAFSPKKPDLIPTRPEKTLDELWEEKEVSFAATS